MRPASIHYRTKYNSHLADKTAIRRLALQETPGKEIRILDAFAGNGVIWRAMAKFEKRKIEVTAIEKQPGMRGEYIQGDNVKILASLDLSKFDLIDLDSYGVPYKQLREIFKKGYQGTVVCTFIQKVGGRLHDGMLQELGYSLPMIKKTPLLFCRHGIQKFDRYLAAHGVTRVTGIEYDRKTYLYFRTATGGLAKAVPNQG